MNINLLDKFNLLKERESYANVKKNIDSSVATKGTNLWILFFAILIASLGLNINSTPVVIGAMLISPLIGPIVGLGFGVATNDQKLIKTGLISYTFSTVVGIGASFVYFLITPIDDAHSEILSRVSPSLYDVLIALFGGFAGIIAITSKQKGNVIPGVAIATAIMPPLCTAGYGLATGQYNFFLGAFYLFLINSVFIFTATMITTRYLRFRVKKYDDPSMERKEKIITWTIILLTLIPSFYMGINMVKKNNFINSAEKFIKNEVNLPNDFLLSKHIYPDSNKIELVFGGRIIEEKDIIPMRKKLKYYNLEGCELSIRNGFSISDNKNLEEWEAINKVIGQTSLEKNMLQFKLDSLETRKKLDLAITSELKVLNPEIEEAIITSQGILIDSTQAKALKFIVLIKTTKNTIWAKRATIKSWLKIRLEAEEIELIIHSGKNLE